MRRRCWREELRAAGGRAEKIEIVDIFRRAEEVAAVVEARFAWARSRVDATGVENEVAAERARAAGLAVVEDSCILIEHRKRLRQLNS